ncbi:hypothetical protein [Streptomyces carpinensis]|uniref:Uncharacterized protein n=1 Tax=Streptomyces carpinensis TaxID=66369 RepID=A0ABV1W0M1_9ACTN
MREARARHRFRTAALRLGAWTPRTPIRSTPSITGSHKVSAPESSSVIRAETVRYAQPARVESMGSR